MTGQLMRRRTPKQRRSRATVEAILEAGEKIFTDTDVANVNTRQIAERAGVGVGSFYEYYADKDALVRALVERFAQEISQEVNAVFDARIDESLEIMIPRLLRSLIEVYDRNSVLHGRLVRIVPLMAGDNPLDLIEGPIRDRFAALVASCTDRSSDDVYKVALVIVHAGRRLVDAACADDRVDIDLQEIEAELVTLSLGYLRGCMRPAT